MELDPTLLTPARLAKLGFDVGALRARFYEQDDLPLLQAWWSSRHGEDLPVGQTLRWAVGT